MDASTRFLEDILRGKQNQYLSSWGKKEENKNVRPQSAAILDRAERPVCLVPLPSQ
jgi:hypothetical protein